MRKNLISNGTGFFSAVFLSTALIGASDTAQASGELVFSQGFETDTAGWFDEDNGWAGSAVQVPSGTNGISSASGSSHAIFTQTFTANAGGTTGPFTRFDGYRTTFNPYTASIDIYLDTSWSLGEGFDYTVASNGSDGSHQRDFIFHVTQDTSSGKLLVGGSNNTNFDPREDLETLNSYEVTSSGWYTFEHDFRDAGDGTLAVDLNLYDSSGTLLFTETRNDPSDTIPAEVGGNRYGWFTNIDVAGGVAVDNTELTVVPTPTAAIGCAALLGGLSLRRRRKQA